MPANAACVPIQASEALEPRLKKAQERLTTLRGQADKLIKSRQDACPTSLQEDIEEQKLEVDSLRSRASTDTKAQIAGDPCQVRGRQEAVRRAERGWTTALASARGRERSAADVASPAASLDWLLASQFLASESH